MANRIYNLDLFFLSLDYDEKECRKESIELCLEDIEMERKHIFPNRTFIAIRKMIYSQTLYCMLQMSACNVNVCRFDAIRFV